MTKRTAEDVLASLDEHQRHAASVECNTVVSAGAGSGKTRVLVSRFVWLIIEKRIPIDRIVALTFTKKAVAELNTRIYAELAENKHPLAQKALKDFHTAQIQTLDSYCARIARLASRFYGISPDFVIDDDACILNAQEAAVPFVIEHASNPSVQKLISAFSIRTLAEEVFAKTVIEYSCISHPLDFTAMLELQKKTVSAQWKSSSDCINILIGEIGSLVGEQKKETKALIGVKEALRSNYIEGDCISYVTYLRHFAAVSFRGKTSDEMRGIKDAITRVRELLVRDIEPLADFILQADIVAGIFDVIGKFQDMMIRKKRRDGIVTFADVARLALDTLLEHSDIRRLEKQRCDIIMIDEFQDNNALQRDMLFLLAEHIDRTACSVPQRDELCEGKLFFVGDEKQSIYKFRGADVSVFRALSNDVTHHIQLLTNYRSDARLIDGFNRLFGTCSSPVFSPDASLKADYEASYTEAQAGGSEENVKEKKHVHTEPLIQCCFFDKTTLPCEDDLDTLSASETEAVYAAQRIRALVDSQEYTYDDIALLFRSLTHQIQYERYLRAYNIPYVADSLSSLFTEAPILDMYHMLRLLVYPKESATYAAVLKSPLIHMSEAGMHVCILSLDTASVFDEALDDVLCLYNLPASDSKALTYGRDLYVRLKAKAAELPISSLISTIWYDEGYRYETLWNERVQLYKELYDFFFELACRADERNKTLSGFIDEMQRLIADNERIRDLDIPMERSGGVHIMSIHKSKGLEFPIVFVCDAGNTGRRHTNASVLFFSECYGISLNLPDSRELGSGIGNYFYNEQKELEKRKGIAELRRLLYVALTRAEKKLYILGSFGQKPRRTRVSDQADVDTSIAPVVDVCAALVVGSGASQASGSSAPLQSSLRNRISAVVEKKEIDTDDTPSSINAFTDMIFPALVSFFREEELNLRELPCAVCEIPLMKRSEISATYVSSINTSFCTKKDAQSAFLPVLSQSYLVCLPQLESDIITPSSLHVFSDSDISDNGDTVAGETRVSVRIDTELIHSLSAVDFGTVVHCCIESRITQLAVSIPTRIRSQLSAFQLVRVTADAQVLADHFFNSPLGRLLEKALWKEAEFEFLSLATQDTAFLYLHDVQNTSDMTKPLYVRGQIDLVFEYDDCVYVVDFKSDTVEHPESYAAQLALYKKAAQDIWQKPVKVALFYVRSGHTVEL